MRFLLAFLLAFTGALLSTDAAFSQSQPPLEPQTGLTLDPERYGTGTSPVTGSTDASAGAVGAVDVDVNATTDADTDASGIDETDEQADTTGAYGDTDSLPDTASKLPLLGLIGVLTLFLAIGLRIHLRKN